VSELRSALDGLAEIDLAALSDDALLDLVGELCTAANRVAATLTSAVRAADRRGAYRRDGAVSMKGRLLGSCPVGTGGSDGDRLDRAPAGAATGHCRRLRQRCDHRHPMRG
jgi:hypothetical protein